MAVLVPERGLLLIRPLRIPPPSNMPLYKFPSGAEGLIEFYTEYDEVKLGKLSPNKLADQSVQPE